MWPDQDPCPDPYSSDDVNERYAGDRIPPFYFVDDVDPWTGEPIADPGPPIVLLTPDI